MLNHYPYSLTKECRFNSRKYSNKAVLILAASGCIAGCSTFSTIGELPALTKIENQINNISISPRLKLGEFDEKQFTECMLPFSSNIKPGLIEMAAQAKTFNGELSYDLMNRLSDLDGIVLFDEASLLGRLLAHLPIAINLPGAKVDAPISPLHQRVRDDFDRFLVKFKQGEHVLQVDAEQVFSLSKQYLLAYFKKGTIEVASQELNNQMNRQKGLEETAKLLQIQPDDPAFLKAANLLNSGLKKVSQSAERKAPSFIGRDCTQYGFPGTTEQNGPVCIDHNQISADGVRLLMEAFRDTFAPLPVLTESTAATKGGLTLFAINFDDQGQLTPERDGDSQLQPGWENKYLINSDGTVQFIWRYDHRNPTQSALITITDDKFQEIEAHARKAEAQVAGIVGKAIRGSSWGALNNEAIATLIETAAGVLARHTLERASGVC